MAVIGITDLPIVDSEAEATIYGRATGDGAGVISSFHFQEPGNRVFLSTAVHETCHVFGLDHCDYFKCVMNPECDAEEMDSASLLLCPICLAKLHYCMKFNVKERYDAMRIALQKLGLSQEAKAIADLRLLE
jgi:predicted Zn-dependent protease